MVKNPGNGRLNNLNDPVLNVLKKTLLNVKSIRLVRDDWMSMKHWWNNTDTENQKYEKPEKPVAIQVYLPQNPYGMGWKWTDPKRRLVTWGSDCTGRSHVCFLYSIRNNQLSVTVQCDITNTSSATGNHYNETENWMGKTGGNKGNETFRAN